MSQPHVAAPSPNPKTRSTTHREKVEEEDQGAEQGALHIVYVGDGRQGVHGGYLLGVGGLLGAQDPEDGCSLGVTDVVDLLVSRLAQDVVDIGRKVVLAHLVKGEVPELLIVAIQTGVVLGVPIAPRVAHPHVVAQIGEHVAWITYLI